MSCQLAIIVNLGAKIQKKFGLNKGKRVKTTFFTLLWWILS